jgi:hypothetical protein
MAASKDQPTWCSLVSGQHESNPVAENKKHKHSTTHHSCTKHAVFSLNSFLGYVWHHIVKQMSTNDLDIHTISTFRVENNASRFLQNNVTWLQGIWNDLSAPQKLQPCIPLWFFPHLSFPWQYWTMQRISKYFIFTLSFRSAVKTCCRIGLMYLSGRGLNLFCLRKSYKFCSSISNTKQVWFLCWKHSYARTKLNSSAFSWLRRDRMLT